MRGLRQLPVALVACLAIACGGTPASPSPSPAPTFVRTPDSTSGPPTLTPPPVTQAVPGELTAVWEPTGCGVTGVAPIFEDRLISVGLCDAQAGSRGVAWETKNGFEWRRVFETESDVTLSAVSTDGETGGALIGGWVPDGTPKMWRGDIFDGFDQDEPATLPIERKHGTVRAIEWGDGDYLAVGSENVSDGQNWPAVWHYADTGPWTRIDAPPDAGAIDDVFYGPDSFTYTVAGVNYDFQAAIWRLTNGTDWTPATVLPAGLEQSSLTLLDAHTALSLNALWEEDEDGEWHFTPLLSGVDAFAGVILGEGIVVFGATGDSSDDLELAVLAAGANRRWVPVDIDPSDRRKIIRSAVLFADRVVAGGDAVWVGPDSIANYLR